MASNKENTKPAEAFVDVGSAEDVDAVMKKYDRESNVRIWEGVPATIIRVLMIAFSLICIGVTLFSTALMEIRLMSFLGMIIIIGYLNFPFKKGDTRVNHIPIYDIVLMVAGAFGCFYYCFNAQNIIKLATRVTKNNFMIAIAIITILSLMELCRRSVGIPILCVIVVLLGYTFYNVRFGKVIYDLFYATSGIMGTPVNVCAKYIVVFIIFGAFLERTGISAFFIDLANSVAGASAGGPAKVAVLSSALCGMVSGSSVGNTVTTGSVTIPMMKKTGYKSDFAGAVEAAASTGGQIMPPIMGAAAFLMAEYMGVTYAEIALRAILPAILYFTGIYIAVHLEAKKLGLKGVPKDQLPKFSKLIKKVYLLFPIVLLVVMVSTNTRTMQFSAAVAIVATIVVGLINRDDPITIKKCLDALEAGAKGTISVAVACAMAGVVSGCITSTGLASKMISAIVSVSQGHAMVALVLTMLCCIVLGMGVPTTATYCIMAATCAPILVSPEIGIPVMAAHFFVFYFGIVADITPPVALAAYAGSAIAKSSPMKTAFIASRLAIAAFIVPYICALNPQMLLIDASVLSVIQIVISAIIGIFGVSAGLSGFLYKPMNIVTRILAIAGGLTLLIPGLLTDIIGLVIIVGLVFIQKAGTSKQAAA
ncbi:MAG: TRAP transporter permease [Blautia sp.]|nr:TRAP transporter permease [Blautia sp.]